MTYKLKEYTFVFDTPAKKHQERVIVDKIMDLLNAKKIQSIEDFIKDTKDYKTFLSDNHLDNVVKHFGNTITEEDFRLILESLKKLSNTKQDFNTENIKTSTIGDKQYNAYKSGDKSYYLDNSSGDKSIEAQMKDLQPTEQKFQTSDKEKNAESIFGELEQNKKESLNFLELNQINTSSLTLQELEIYNVAANFELKYGKKIKLDIKKGVITDEENNIMKIEEHNGEYIIMGNESEILEHESKEATKQFVLKPNSNPNN